MKTSSQQAKSIIQRAAQTIQKLSSLSVDPHHLDVDTSKRLTQMLENYFTGIPMSRVGGKK
jgi:hypothetical protein